jgi:hypothetical protein
MSLMSLNILAAWYLLFLTAPWLFTQTWMKGLEGERGFIEKTPPKAKMRKTLGGDSLLNRRRLDAKRNRQARR